MLEERLCAHLLIKVGQAKGRYRFFLLQTIHASYRPKFSHLRTFADSIFQIRIQKNPTQRGQKSETRCIGFGIELAYCPLYSSKVKSSFRLCTGSSALSGVAKFSTRTNPKLS